MSKVVDITEKLEFNENPKIKIKGEKIEINSDAASVIKLLGTMKQGEEINPGTVYEMYEILFNKKDRKKIEDLKLSFHDLQVLIEEATNLVVGAAEEEVGE